MKLHPSLMILSLAAVAVAAGAVSFRELPPLALASDDAGSPFRLGRLPEWDFHNFFSDGLVVCWRVYNGEVPHDRILHRLGECDGNLGSALFTESV